MPLFSGHHRDGFDFEQVFGGGELHHLHRGRGRRGFGIEVTVAHLAEHRKLLCNVGEITRDLDHVLEAAAGGGQCGLQVLDRLRGLAAKVAGHLAVHRHAHLPGNVDGAAGSGRLHHVRVAARRVNSCWILKAVNGHVSLPLVLAFMPAAECAGRLSSRGTIQAAEVRGKVRRMNHLFTPHVVFGIDAMWVSLAVLVLTYGFVIAGPVDRAVVALLAAAANVLIGALDQREAIRGIDWNTIGLLAGMMMLVAIAQRSGLFQLLAIWSAQRAKANPAGILLMLQLAAAVLAAALDNVSTVLLIVPVTLVIVEELELPAFPFLFAEVFASNVGGTATLIGDPPNIMIGSQAGLGFNAFLVNVAPVAVIVMAVQMGLVHLIWGRSLRASAESRVLVMGMNAGGMVTDWGLLRRSVAVIALVLAAFVFARPLRLEPATIALAGAALLMLLDTIRSRGAKRLGNVQATFAEIEWTTIFFFVGLFVVVHAVESSGLLALLGGKLVALTGGNLASAGTLILWMSAILSAMLDNIPFVATMIPLIKGMAPAFGGPHAIEPLWWCLSLGACLGGNATLTGASANLAVAGLAERNGIRFGFVRYFTYGAPLTLVSIAIC